ncbi:hypothetical protein F511_16277 [Dorcoceras hygrometricum]|uniref:Helicase domain-containing family protein n=1 Tax=Dorcoceras hygrometricum TaxID=472368 RepID=A0A2Z7CH24_9LAMI|nr:hypothetical protein F511_16277 [Dorcoceras hygrometricum]
MSLFDLQDVCIDIGSITTLDLAMVVDLIGIYGLKGPYCTLTTTNWFLQALSVIPRGSWGDVARRSYHDPMGKSEIVIPEPQWLWAHAEADVNAGQHPCSARRKHRHLASAKEPGDAHIRFPDVNAGQLFCSLQLLQCCVLDVATGTSFWKDFMQEKPADGFRRPAGGRFDDVSGATSF